MSAPVKYFHGSRRGLVKGNFILPPSITKAKSTASFGNHLCDQNQVYVTTDFNAACLYAAGVNGDVYEVEPIGELRHDPDCNVPGLSYSCDRARVLVRFRINERDRAAILRVLTDKVAA